MYVLYIFYILDDFEAAVKLRSRYFVICLYVLLTCWLNFYLLNFSASLTASVTFSSCLSCYAIYVH